eukprot:76192-Pleurochrysis_carterae.AAC.1
MKGKDMKGKVERVTKQSTVGWELGGCTECKSEREGEAGLGREQERACSCTSVKDAREAGREPGRAITGAPLQQASSSLWN